MFELCSECASADHCGCEWSRRKRDGRSALAALICCDVRVSFVLVSQFSKCADILRTSVGPHGSDWFAAREAGRPPFVRHYIRG